MTIGLTALVERYLTERRTLGFQLRSTAYSLRSLAEYVRRTRHRGPLTLEVMAEWARLDSPRQRRSRGPGPAAEALALLRALDAAVRAAPPRCPTTRSSDGCPSARRRTSTAERRCSSCWPPRAQLGPSPGLRGLVYETLFGLIASCGLRLSEALSLTHRRRRSQARPADDPAHEVRQVAPGAAASEHGQGLGPLPLDAGRGRRLTRRRRAVLHRHAGTPVRQADQRDAKWTASSPSCAANWAGSTAARTTRRASTTCRHTFVVRRILLWQQHGIDVDEAMLSLSTYVGHAMVTNTYWYLQAVPELMAVAAQRFESCMPELSHA